MNYLYLDTSNKLTLGVINESLQWIAYKEVDTKKTSDVVHAEILSLLSSINLEFKDVSNLVVMAGPGSYTGMRVSEGIAQVLEMEGIEVFSFHSFRIPEILGMRDSVWVYPAFKGEVFKLENGVKSLVSIDEFNEEKVVLRERLVTHGKSVLSGDCVIDTSEKLKGNPELVFKYVLENKLRDAPYYFRALDVEFKKSIK